ncbi:uncharacterized protein LOC128127062 [Lactuca sativa]|uniref:uncharacterized protein LOC128127062 n=1 Tax=Lactuca sativa TaxID=4236 RepID=UPI000CD880B1|nr:uncharacterized protein LOC128127062 [Lactuca sativa]
MLTSQVNIADVGEDGGPAPVRTKEVGATSVVCPMLTPTNYTVWALRMKVVLRIHKAWTVIDPGTENNEEKDYFAIGLLYQAIPEDLIMQIEDVESAKGLWESIKARYVGADRVKEARLQTLNAEFDRLKMQESETIDSYAGKLSGIASKSAALGETIDESKLVKKFLKTLPRSKFIQIVASFEQVLDLKSVGFEDVVGRLKAYEERIKEEEDDGGEGHARVMLTKSASFGSGGSFGFHGGMTGKAKGKGSSSGTIHGATGSNGGSSGSGPNVFKSKQAQDGEPNSNCKNCNCCCHKNWKNREKYRSKVICFRCDKPGHFASECPERLQKLQEGDFSEHGDSDESVFLNTDRVEEFSRKT